MGFQHTCPQEPRFKGKMGAASRYKQHRSNKTKNIHDSGRKKKAKEKKQAAWKYREVRKAMAKTGEEFKWPWVLNGTGALLGIAFYLWRRSEKTR